jgi:hypothetical protein
MKRFLLLFAACVVPCLAQQQPFPGSPSLGAGNAVLYNGNGVIASATGFTYSPTTTNVVMPTSLAVGAPGGVAGNSLLPCGPLPLPMPNSDGWTAPTNCTGRVVRIVPGAAGGGIFQGFSGSGTDSLGQFSFVKYGSSGDANHSTGRVQNVTTSVPTTVLCSFSYCQQGAFKILLHVSSSASCGNATGATVGFVASWTDDVGAKSQTIPLTVNGSATQTTTMALGNTTNAAFGEISFYNASVSNISISSTLMPCTTGTATYNYDAQTVETQ